MGKAGMGKQKAEMKRGKRRLESRNCQPWP
jgi:hypothetical protein